MSRLPHATAIIGPKWTARFLDLAQVVAGWSKDPSTQVGAVVVNNRRRVVGLGYNGFPDRIADDPALLADRDAKISMVIHAEANAILNANGPVEGCALFVTHPPCADCAKFIIQSGITEVHFRVPDDTYADRWADNIKAAQAIFKRADVPMHVSV